MSESLLLLVGWRKKCQFGGINAPGYYPKRFN